MYVCMHVHQDKLGREKADSDARVRDVEDAAEGRLRDAIKKVRGDAVCMFEHVCV
jgi:hypothetical protein